MSCLKDYIGIKHSSQATPESGVYVNILPGISTELAQNISNDDQITFLDVWNDIQERAYMRFKNDVASALLIDGKADFRNVIYETKKLLKKERNIVSIPAAPEYRGVYFSLPESRYSQFRISEIYVYALQAGTTELRVFDLNDGEILFEDLEIDIEVGLNVIPVNQVFDLKYRILELFVGIDASLFDTIETLGEYYNLDTCSSGCGEYRSARIYPATLALADDAYYENLALTGEGKGVVVGAQISCSIDEFICRNKHNFQQSWLYLLGAELLQQKLSAMVGTTRLNYFTVSNGEQTKETMNTLFVQYRGNLKREVKGVPIDNESICFSCEDNLQIFTGGSMP
jgi:hypothetical protein